MITIEENYLGIPGFMALDHSRPCLDGAPAALVHRATRAACEAALAQYLAHRDRNRLSPAWRARMAVRPLRYSKHVVAERLVCDVIMRKWSNPDTPATSSNLKLAFESIAEEIGPKIRWIDFRGTGIYL